MKGAGAVVFQNRMRCFATSLVVLAFVVVMAIFLGVVDLGLSKLISFILAA